MDLDLERFMLLQLVMVQLVENICVNNWWRTIKVLWVISLLE